MSEHQHLIGIAQMKISKDPSEVLVAPNLGSCLGIAAYDHVNKCGGMIHCLLPMSKSDPEKAKANPCMYVDTGLALLLHELAAAGSDIRKLSIVVAGGANINDDNNVFEIGKKNCVVFKKMLWKNNLLARAEHLGDSVSRTISLKIDSGKTFLKINGEVIEL